MSLPTYDPHLKSDYSAKGLGSTEDLDKFFNRLNSDNQATQQTLGGGLSWKNLNGTEVSFTIKTPATDWQPMTLTAPFAPVGFAPVPAYRVTQGGKVELRGGFNAASGPTDAQTFWTYPSTALAPSGSSGLAIGRYVSVPMAFNGNAFSAMVRFDFNTASAIYQGLAGANTYFGLVGAVVARTGVSIGSLDGISWDCVGGPTVGALSCFPLAVKIDAGKVPKHAWLTSVQDQGPSAPICNPGTMLWGATPAKAGFPNTLNILNIPGLALGRTYACRAAIIYQ